jgi:uncharacterized membrane protein (DUF106 family)
MPRTASKIQTLVDEDPSMESAVEAILDTADEKGVVEWSDVSEDLTSGQWGRLIEKGILVDADGSGFVVDDPEGVREALSDADPSEDDDGESSWTKWDKLAGLAAVAMVSGYAITEIQTRVGNFVDIFVGPLDSVLPFYLVILILAVMTGLVSAVFQDRMTDMSNMSGYQEKQKELREREKKAKERDDDEALEEIRKEQMEMMGENLGMMKEQFRSMPWIMLFTIPAFLYIYWMVLTVGIGGNGETVIVMPLIGAISDWQASVAGPLPFQAWILWYIVCSISLSQVIRKALNVQTSPT